MRTRLGAFSFAIATTSTEDFNTAVAGRSQQSESYVEGGIKVVGLVCFWTVNDRLLSRLQFVLFAACAHSQRVAAARLRTGTEPPLSGFLHARRSESLRSPHGVRRGAVGCG